MNDAKDDRKHLANREVEKLIANHQETIRMVIFYAWGLGRSFSEV